MCALQTYENVFSSNREAGSKLVSSIRAALVKGRSNGDPVYLAAEDTAKSLKERIGQIHTMQMHSAVGTGISPARVKKRMDVLSLLQIFLPTSLISHNMFPF